MKWVDIPMEDESASGGESLSRLKTRVEAPGAGASYNVTKVANTSIDDLCSLDSVEKVSDVGGKALGTPMLFCSPDLHL